ncbi:MAG TPA: heme-binding protein [Rhodocyclaceae bacterium]|nr:heme-binding protein [Rhodocyclaceae bacterium]
MQSPSTLQILEYGPPISLDLAKKVMAAAEAESLANRWPMAVAIVDSTGHLVLLQKLDQAQYGSIAVAQSKAETAVNFRRPTKVFEDAIAAGGVGTRLLSINNACSVEGGIPLILDGKVVGGIGVSGMHSSHDAQVAMAGANALTRA